MTLRSAVHSYSRWASRAILTFVAAGFLLILISLFGHESARADDRPPLLDASEVLAPIRTQLSTGTSGTQRPPAVERSAVRRHAPAARFTPARKGARPLPVERAAVKVTRPANRLIGKVQRPTQTVVAPVAHAVEGATGPVVGQVADRFGLRRVLDGVVGLVYTGSPAVGGTVDEALGLLGPARPAVPLLPAAPVVDPTASASLTDAPTGALTPQPIGPFGPAFSATQALHASADALGAEPTSVGPQADAAADSWAAPTGPAAVVHSAGGGTVAAVPSAGLSFDVQAGGDLAPDAHFAPTGRNPRPGTSPA